MNNKLLDTLASINKEYGKDTIRFGLGYDTVPRIPFSSIRVNYMTYGGIPIGRTTEIFGPESGGKTTTAIDLVVQAQRLCEEDYANGLADYNTRLEDTKLTTKARSALEAELEDFKADGPRRVLYVDTERTLDYAWAEKLGVDTSKLLVLDSGVNSAEEVLQSIVDLVGTGAIKLVVLDSVPMLIPQQLVDEDLSKKSFGGIAGVLTEFGKRITPRLRSNNTALLLINQVRDDLANPYNMYKTPGGKAVKHLSSVRLYVRKGHYIDADNREVKGSEEHPYGNIVEIQVIKSKSFPPDRRVGSYTLRYDTGIDCVGDLLLHGAYLGVIEQAGAFFTLPEENGEGLKFRGRVAALEYLRSNPEYYEWLYKKTLGTL